MTRCKRNDDIFDRLAKADPGNAGWQRDLSVFYEKIGDVLVMQGNLPEALTSFRDGLAIADRLAKADPGNAGWQRDLRLQVSRGYVSSRKKPIPTTSASLRLWNALLSMSAYGRV